MKALVVIAHGSRRAGSNEEFCSLVATVKASLKEQYPIVEAAFLELAQPSIEQAMGNAANQGATEVSILPYFLNAGVHVEKDIPMIVSNLIDQYPQCEFNVFDHVGKHEVMAEVLVNQALNRLGGS